MALKQKSFFSSPDFTYLGKENKLIYRMTTTNLMARMGRRETQTKRHSEEMPDGPPTGGKAQSHTQNVIERTNQSDKSGF